MSTKLDPKTWISQAEAARIRSVSRQAISTLVKKGRFRTLEIGGKLLVHKVDVESYEPKISGPEPKTIRSHKRAAVKQTARRVKAQKPAMPGKLK